MFSRLQLKYKKFKWFIIKSYPLLFTVFNVYFYVVKDFYQLIYVDHSRRKYLSFVL